MTLHIGDTAPDFSVDTQNGEISFHDWADDAWVFFFIHPADFTPVCTTEMGRTAQLADQFAARNTTPIGRAHVLTPVTNAHLVCRHLIDTKNKSKIQSLTRIPYYVFS